MNSPFLTVLLKCHADGHGDLKRFETPAAGPEAMLSAMLGAVVLFQKQTLLKPTST